MRTSKLRGGWQPRVGYLPLGHLLILARCFEVRKTESLGEECMPYKGGQLAKCSSRAFSPSCYPAEREPLIFVDNASEAWGFLRKRGKLLFNSELNDCNSHHHKQKQKTNPPGQTSWSKRKLTGLDSHHPLEMSPWPVCFL